jgi:hypothetical protein
MRRKTQSLLTDQPPTSREYLAALENKVMFELDTSPFLPFESLVTRMEGAYPTDIVTALARLKDAGKIVHPINNQSHTAISEQLKHNESVGSDKRFLLPEPHPLDYDWRFSPQSLSVFDRLFVELGSKRVAVLGAPSLYLHLSTSPIVAHLYDKNAHLIEQLRDAGFLDATHCDLFEYQPDADNFDAVVADPPWYVEHYFAFIDSARAILQPQGHLIASVPPRLTRPSAADDRKAIIDYAFDMGFDIYAVHRGALQYDSPPFEVAALRAEGIELRDWRYGDIFVFTLSPRPTAIHRTKRPPERDKWESFVIGKTIVRIRRRTPDSHRVIFEPVSPSGDIRLHSVSRRSPVRSEADLWTSRNLALKVSGTGHLCSILTLAQQGINYDEAVKQVARANALEKSSEDALRDIINLLAKDAEINTHG